MSKPKLDTNAVLKELGAVASFARQRTQDANSSVPPDTHPAKPIQVMPGEPKMDGDASQPNMEHASFSASVPVSPPGLTPGRTSERRTITRYAFEFYHDQVQSLRSFSLEEKGMGEKGSMSEMVRQAIDAYIAKRLRLEE